MAKRTVDEKASETYFKPRDRFYEFVENHEELNAVRRKKERKGALYMTGFFVMIITLAILTHENAEYNLVTKIFD